MTHTGSLAVYVSGHGYGHSTRTAEVLRAVRERAPGLRDRGVHVGAGVPLRGRRQAAARRCAASSATSASSRRTPSSSTRPARSAAWRAFMAGWDGRVAQEAAWLREVGARLVLGDIPPLAFAAAAEAGVRVGRPRQLLLGLDLRPPGGPRAGPRRGGGAGRRGVRAGGPAAAAALRGRPLGLPAHRGRAARGAEARGGRRPRRVDAWGSTRRPAVLLSFGGLGLPGPAACGARVAGRVPVPAHRRGGRRPGAGESPTNRRPGARGGRPRVPGPRRRRRRGGDEARLRHRDRLHRGGNAARLHRSRRLPGVPDHGGGDAALPAGRVRVERGRPRGPARSRARGRCAPCRSPIRPAPTARQSPP